MVEAAVRTTASPAALWVICAIAVACLAFWLSMVMVVANRPDPRHRRVAGLPGPVLGGMHLAEGGRSVAPNRHAPAILQDAGSAGTTPAPETAAGEPARPRVPVQRGPGAPAEPVPAQGPAQGRAQGPAQAQRQGPVSPGADPEAPTEPIPAQRGAGTGQPAAARADGGAPGRS